MRTLFAVRIEDGGAHLVVVRQRRSERLAGARVPHPRGFVEAAGEKFRAVGTERERANGVFVFQFDAERFPRQAVEQLRDVAVAADGGEFGIGTERNGVEALAVADGLADRLPGAHVPQSRGAIRRAVMTAGEHGEAVGPERE